MVSEMVKPLTSAVADVAAQTLSMSILTNRSEISKRGINSNKGSYPLRGAGTVDGNDSNPGLEGLSVADQGE
jgi:hypothetical protein